jgi:hypothetical protein
MEFAGLETHRLIPHPATPPRSVRQISVQVVPGEHEIELAWLVACPIDALLLPELAAPNRCDGLWAATCLELFVRGEGESYLEFNFSPSTQWAAYRFDSYRSGMQSLGLDRPPRILNFSDAQGFHMTVLLPPILAAGAQLALSAVIEEIGGHKSYWALAHPPGKPDFHHPTCFAARLPPPTPA